VNDTDMLHQMCHGQLSRADMKAICKNRRLPGQAASSGNLLEGLFFSDTGVADALETLEPDEIAAMYLLGTQEEPVDLTFFSRIYPVKDEHSLYLTFTQQHQGVLAKVKERLVRKGVLLLAAHPDLWPKKTKMDRWRFVLPKQFVAHLPPLIPSARLLEEAGQWRAQTLRDKLKSVVTRKPATKKAKTDKDCLEIVGGQLCMGGDPFRAARLLQWQQDRWQKEAKQKNPAKRDSCSLPPVQAVVRILSRLEESSWADAEGLAIPLKVFCGPGVDTSSICEVGWKYGCLARQQDDGRNWYRLPAHPSAADVSPQQYLEVASDGSVTVDLDVVPLESLEQIVEISDQQPVAGRRAALLITPNVIKLGRASEAMLSAELVDWLQKNSASFEQAVDAVRSRRGKTILHENLAVARVSDLTLKVAIEKAMGNRIVSLGKEYIAIPNGLVADVRRVVTKSGHVVKEI